MRQVIFLTNDEYNTLLDTGVNMSELCYDNLYSFTKRFDVIFQRTALMLMPGMALHKMGLPRDEFPEQEVTRDEINRLDVPSHSNFNCRISEKSIILWEDTQNDPVGSNYSFQNTLARYLTELAKVDGADKALSSDTMRVFLTI